MTCPTCHSPTRVVTCREVDGQFVRRRLCDEGHRFNTAEDLRPGPFPWRRVKKPYKPKPKAKLQSTHWLDRIEAALATP